MRVRNNTAGLLRRWRRGNKSKTSTPAAEKDASTAVFESRYRSCRQMISAFPVAARKASGSFMQVNFLPAVSAPRTVRGCGDMLLYSASFLHQIKKNASCLFCAPSHSRISPSEKICALFFRMDVCTYLHVHTYGNIRRGCSHVFSAVRKGQEFAKTLCFFAKFFSVGALQLFCIVLRYFKQQHGSFHGNILYLRQKKVKRRGISVKTVEQKAKLQYNHCTQLFGGKV